MTMEEIYDPAQLSRIAGCIGASVAKVSEYQQHFAAAATWYRLDSRSPKRFPPSQLSRKLDVIANHAERLLAALEVADATAPEDGFANMSILEALASDDSDGEDAVLAAAARVGHLVDVLKAAQAAGGIATRARNASGAVRRVGRLTVPPENRGDFAVNAWIAAMLSIYQGITGREIGTSVGGPTRHDKGQAGGPLLRFLDAAGQPLGIGMSADAWRERVRLILRNNALRE